MKSGASRFATQPITADTATDPNVVVGVNLCRWFATHELDALCDETVVRNGFNGERIEGTVVEIAKRTKKKKRRKKRLFVALIALYLEVFGFLCLKPTKWRSALNTIEARQEVKFMYFRNPSHLYPNDFARD